ncbi:hypothetical protein CR513_42539, partial [Mucuna pruriens]
MVGNSNRREGKTVMVPIPKTEDLNYEFPPYTTFSGDVGRTFFEPMHSATIPSATAAIQPTIWSTTATTLNRSATVAPDNVASSSGGKLRAFFIGMGFLPCLVDKVIEENGEENSETLLEALLRYSSPGWNTSKAIYRNLKLIYRNLEHREEDFKKNGNLQIEVYNDADWAGSIIVGRPASGYCAFVRGNLVWNLYQWPMEFVRLCGLKNYRLATPIPMKVYCDNKSANSVARSPVSMTELKLDRSAVCTYYADILITGLSIRTLMVQGRSAPNFYPDGHSKEVAWCLISPLLLNFKPFRLEILVLFTDCMVVFFAPGVRIWDGKVLNATLYLAFFHASPRFIRSGKGTVCAPTLLMGNGSHLNALQ